DGYAAIVAVHGAWFAGLLLEGQAPWTGRALLVPGGLLFVFGMALRYWAMGSLGERWSTRVFVLDGPLVRRGPYRFLRNPIYVGVWIELVALPIAFGLWATAAFAAAANLAALIHRSRIEGHALSG
ncbi:MAG: isoprenylcysteine carboxylmethyltransferase family protein, partial [Thermoplasmatota archaeon]